MRKWFVLFVCSIILGGAGSVLVAAAHTEDIEDTAPLAAQRLADRVAPPIDDSKAEDTAPIAPRPIILVSNPYVRAWCDVGDGESPRMKMDSPQSFTVLNMMLFIKRMHPFNPIIVFLNESDATQEERVTTIMSEENCEATAILGSKCLSDEGGYYTSPTLTTREDPQGALGRIIARNNSRGVLCVGIHTETLRKTQEALCNAGVRVFMLRDLCSSRAAGKKIDPPHDVPGLHILTSVSIKAP